MNPGPANSRVRALIFYTVFHVCSNYLSGAYYVLDTLVGAWDIPGIKQAKKTPVLMEI